VHFEANETGLLFRCILVAIERRPPSLYPEVHELLAEYALDAMPIEAWKAHFGEAIDVVIVAPAQPDR
jgi:hypothetical protein